MGTRPTSTTDQLVTWDTPFSLGRHLFRDRRSVDPMFAKVLPVLKLC